MTLIAAVRSPKGIALCADSQETVTQYDENGQPYEVRVTVQKIAPIVCGKYQIAIAGAGAASLIEAFIERAKRALQAQDAIVCTREKPASVIAVRDRLEQELSNFYANDVVACPDDKNFDLFIAACCPVAQQYAFWISQYTVLRDLRSDRPELIGWEHGLYSETANRLFSSDMTVAQAVLASIYTITIAKETSNYVRDPLSVAVVNKDGIWIEKAAYLRSMAERLDDFEVRMNRLFLACCDTAISVPDLDDQIEEFRKAAIDLHREHINQQAAKTSIEQLFSNNPLEKLPMPITLMGSGDLVVEHDREKINQTLGRWREMITMVKSPPSVYRCACGTEVEYEMEKADGGTLISHAISGKATSIGILEGERSIPGSLECPNCKAVIPTPTRLTRYRQIGPTKGLWTEIEMGTGSVSG